MTYITSEYFKISPEMICIVDLEGRFLDINPSWSDHLGWKPEMVVGLTYKDFVHPDDISLSYNELSKISLENIRTSNGFENRFRHKNGSYRWLQWSIAFIESENHLICIARDITQNKRDSILLTETENVSMVGSWEIDLITGELFWSRMCHHIHETDPEIYKPTVENGRKFFTPDAQKIIESHYHDLINHGVGYDFELGFMTNKGRKTWVRCVARASIRDGSVLRVFGTIEDVGAKKIEKSRNELIIENGNYGAWDWDLETDDVIFNDRWCSMIGYDVNAIEHKLSTWDKLTHPEDKIQTYKDIEDHLSGKTPYYRNVHRMKHSNGKWVWILDQGKVVEYRDGRPVRFSGTHTDVTYLKELESAKIDLAGKLRMVHSAASLGVWYLDLVTGEIGWDDNMYDLFQISRDKYPDITQVWNKMVHPDDLERTSNIFNEVLEKRKDIEFDYRIILSSGEIRYLANKGVVEFDLSGTAIKCSGISWDITTKVEQQKIFETIVNNIPIMITFYDVNGNVEWVNSRWTEVLGWSLADLSSVGNLTANLFRDEADQKNATEFMMEAPDEWREFTLLKKNGEHTHTIWTNVKLSDGKIIGIGQDIDEKKKQEEVIKDQQARMISTAKLSSLGEMASGIAHEINNPLAIIKGKAYQILKKLGDGEVDVSFLIKEIGKIEQNSLRIAKIIKGLRTFSRHGDKDPFQVVVFNSLLSDVLELCNERFKHQGVELKTSGDLETNISCQEAQLAQVLLNLINNAYDAVVDNLDPWVEVNVNKEGEIVKISITDSGPGISDEIAQKIMQPFFTTKEVGVGTGLGLSISKGIVEMHGGKFYLDQSCPNTRFVIELPTTHS